MGVEGVLGVAVPQAVKAPIIGVGGVVVGFVVGFDGLVGFGGVGGGVGGVGGVITAAMTSAPSPLNAVFMLAFAPVSTPVSPVNSATRTIASASSFTDA